MIKMQYNVSIMEWFSDNGSEYVNKKYINLLKDHGMVIFRRILRQPQMNGHAERFNHMINIKAEALCFQVVMHNLYVT